jgi:hypothetical protein
MTTQQRRGGDSGSEGPDRALASCTMWYGSSGPSDQWAWLGHPNVVEVIRIEQPTSGDYLVRVVTDEMLHAPQDMALVVSGALRSKVERTF